MSHGIEIVDPRKHWPIDPTKYDPRELEDRTDPEGWGSKWLAGITPQDRFEMIKRVLEDNGACLGVPGTYAGAPGRVSIGVSGGQFVRTIEVRFDGRYAHGYPCPP